jgi:hypothetical protein
MKMYGARTVPFNKAALDALNGGGLNLLALDAAVAGGMTFLQAELEKRDPKVREPMTSVTWMRDIVIKTGGGYVDFTSVFNVDYATAGPNMYGLIGNETNAIPTMQANISKDLFPVFKWGNVMKVPYFDQQQMQQVGRSLDDLLDKGIRTNWNKSLDLVVYNGFGGYGGIVNNVNITAVLAATGASSSRLWSSKTPVEILEDINSAIYATWEASEFDISGMSNYILIPPMQYGLLTAPMTTAGCNSILEYVLKNNIAREQGVELQLMPSRWCIGAGQVVSGSATDRMVAYVNDEDRLYMDIPVPIQRIMTMPSVTEIAYLTAYIGLIGVPKFLYTQPALYTDGI